MSNKLSTESNERMIKTRHLPLILTTLYIETKKVLIKMVRFFIDVLFLRSQDYPYVEMAWGKKETYSSQYRLILFE